mgnify:CR=1 FL=1
MKILANKEIKNSISFAFTGFGGYISLSRGFCYGCHIAGFLCYC